MDVSSDPAAPSQGATQAKVVVADFRAVYDEHLAFVFRTLRRFGVPDASLDDAVQDVFTVVHTKIDGFEGRSTLKTWIFGIARRVAARHRDKGREKLIDGASEYELHPESIQQSDTDRVEKARLLYHLLDKLKPEQREIFLLVELEQFTMREAAEALGENANTLSSRLKRARRELRDTLARMKSHEEWREQWPS